MPNTNYTYHQLIDYMNQLRLHLSKIYPSDYKYGNVYRGNAAFSYFSISTASLKPHKLKYVIVLHHASLSFSICLSGQNKKVRKSFWQTLKDSEWEAYELVPAVDEGLTIIEHQLIQEADFTDTKELTTIIENKSAEFIQSIDALFID